MIENLDNQALASLRGYVQIIGSGLSTWLCSNNSMLNTTLCTGVVFNLAGYLRNGYYCMYNYHVCLLLQGGRKVTLCHLI